MDQPEDFPSRIEAFLRDRLPDAKRVRIIDHAKISGGYSRLMIRFTADIDGVVLKLVSRGDPPPGQSVLDTDRATEWRLLSALNRAPSRPSPQALWFDETGAFLGSPTIVSELVEGQSFLSVLRSCAEQDRRANAARLAQLAARIHAVDLGTLPDDIKHPSSWDEYIDSCIEAWRQTEKEHCQSLPVLRYIGAWLDRNRPPKTELRFVHGEFQASNIIASGSGDLVAADWELGHIGDPREDLGYFRQVATVQPPDVIEWDTEYFCRCYREASGLSEDVLNPATLAYFKILPLGAALAFSLRPLCQVSRGESLSAVITYNLGVLLTWNQGWLRSIPELEAASKMWGRA